MIWNSFVDCWNKICGCYESSVPTLEEILQNQERNRQRKAEEKLNRGKCVLRLCVRKLYESLDFPVKVEVALDLVDGVDYAISQLKKAGFNVDVERVSTSVICSTKIVIKSWD